MSRRNIKRPTKRFCIGDLSTVVFLLERGITEPGFGGADFGEDFPEARDAWALVQTVSGRTRFNGVDTDLVISHEITIRYDSTVTAETWIQLPDGDRLDIVEVEDVNEDHLFLVLQCMGRGTQEASKG